MTGRRVLVGLCMLCALMISAIAAQGANAETKGTTAFTCKEVALGGPETTVGFKDAHCKEPVGDGKTGGKDVQYEHVGFAAETTTTITGNNITTGSARSVAKLKTTQAGVEEELQAGIVEGHGSLRNLLDPTGEHYIHAEGTLTYSEVIVAKPEKKGCKVFEDNEGVEGAEGVVKTKPLTGTSTGQGDRIKLVPAGATPFATFFVTGCSKEELNGTYEVTGSLTATTEGATLVATESDVTTQGTLKTRGQKSGLDGSLTIKGTDIPAGDIVDTPLSVTTVTTP